MVKFSNATVVAATGTGTNNLTLHSVTLVASSSAPTVSFPPFPPMGVDPLIKKIALRSTQSERHDVDVIETLIQSVVHRAGWLCSSRQYIGSSSREEENTETHYKVHDDHS